MWKVYSHTNLINGKVYIGITSKENPNRRWRNGEGYYKSLFFYNAIKKYGWDNFEHKILFENLDENTAKNIEQKLIRKYKKENISYNITDGGDGNVGWVMSDKTKNKISEKHKGKKLSEEHKKHISDGSKGRVVTNETRNKISISNKGHLVSDENKQKFRERINKYIEENGHPNLGKKYTNEEKLNMKMSQKNRIVIERYSENGELIEVFNSIREIRKIKGLNAIAIRKVLDENNGIELKMCKKYKGDIYIRKQI